MPSTGARRGQSLSKRSSIIGEAIAILKRCPHGEHVVIDGSSKDDTVAVARQRLGEGDVLVSEPCRASG